MKWTPDQARVDDHRPQLLPELQLRLAAVLVLPVEKRKTASTPFATFLFVSCDEKRFFRYFWQIPL
jgi:hypothetical protein